MSCYNRRPAGLLFCIQVTGYSKSFNAVFEKNNVKNNILLPEVPERIRSYLQEKKIKKQDQDTGRHNSSRPQLGACGLFLDSNDMDFFYTSVIFYPVRRFQETVLP